MAKYIAAIDFGTSSVSLAYTTPLNRGDVQVLKLNRTYDRVLNAVLIHINDDTGQGIIEDIGLEAQNTYNNELEEDELQEYVYFEQIKATVKDILVRNK